MVGLSDAAYLALLRMPLSQAYIERDLSEQIAAAGERLATWLGHVISYAEAPKGMFHSGTILNRREGYLRTRYSWHHASHPTERRPARMTNSVFSDPEIAQWHRDPAYIIIGIPIVEREEEGRSEAQQTWLVDTRPDHLALDSTLRHHLETRDHHKKVSQARLIGTFEKHRQSFAPHQIVIMGGLHRKSALGHDHLASTHRRPRYLRASTAQALPPPRRGFLGLMFHPRKCREAIH